MYNMTVLALIFQMCKSREELSKIVKFWPFYNPALVPMWARVMSFIVYVLLTPKLHHIKSKRFQEQVKTAKCWHTTTDKKSIAIGYLSFKKKNGAHTFHLCQPHSFTLKLQIYNRNKILALLNLQSVLFYKTMPKRANISYNNFQSCLNSI